MIAFVSLPAAQLGLQVRTFQAALDAAHGNVPMEAALAQKVRGWFGQLRSGGVPKVDQTTVVWAMESSVPPTVVAEDGSLTLPLVRIGTSNVYVAVSQFRSGRGFPYHYATGEVISSRGFLEVYQDDPDMLPQSGVPQGKLQQMPKWTSTIFSQTTRDWWVYTPAGLKPTDRPAVMVFQDGQSMKDYVPVCMDNLIHKHQIPPLVGIFIAPGVKANRESDRSFEYDTLSDRYAQFLLKEILPEVEKATPLTTNPDLRAIAGGSSGGICAFTVAWQRPDAFRKVLSLIGSFTDIAHGPDLMQGGHNYPSLIRLTDKKPIRVYLQDGYNDLDNEFGNWPLANMSMAKALAFKGYDYTFTLGEGNHSDRQARAILPSMLRWLWR